MRQWWSPSGVRCKRRELEEADQHLGDPIKCNSHVAAVAGLRWQRGVRPIVMGGRLRCSKSPLDLGIIVADEDAGPRRPWHRGDGTLKVLDHQLRLTHQRHVSRRAMIRTYAYLIVKGKCCIFSDGQCAEGFDRTIRLDPENLRTGRWGPPACCECILERRDIPLELRMGGRVGHGNVLILECELERHIRTLA